MAELVDLDENSASLRLRQVRAGSGAIRSPDVSSHGARAELR